MLLSVSICLFLCEIISTDNCCIKLFPATQQNIQENTQQKLRKQFIPPLTSSAPVNRSQEVFETSSEKIFWKIIGSSFLNYIVSLYILSLCNIIKTRIAVFPCWPRFCQQITVKHLMHEKYLQDWSLNYDMVMLQSVGRLPWCTSGTETKIICYLKV